MAPPKKSTISVTCPKCGHTQPEPRSVYSTICKQCHSHFRLEEATPVETKPKKPAIEVKQVICFQCGTELAVPAAAESTMCKRCSSHVDLRDYQINVTVSKNFRTHGRMVLEEKGYILNTDSLVGDAVIKGRFIGKIEAVRTLEIYSSANIKGSFKTGKLIVPAANHFRWSETLEIGGAEIAGELAANVRSHGTVVLKSTARVFGDIESRNLIVESGAIFVGTAKITPLQAKAPAPGVAKNEVAATEKRPTPAKKRTTGASGATRRTSADPLE